MGVTDDPTDPRLARGIDDVGGKPQAEVYLVLSDEERAKGFVRPYRDTYSHKVCRTTTTMNRAIAETYARDPSFYGATFCVRCGGHFALNEFVWVPDGSEVGS